MRQPCFSNLHDHTPTDAAQQYIYNSLVPRFPHSGTRTLNCAGAYTSCSCSGVWEPGNKATFTRLILLAGAVSYSQSSNVELGQSWQYRVYSSKGIIRAIIAQSQ